MLKHVRVHPCRGKTQSLRSPKDATGMYQFLPGGFVSIGTTYRPYVLGTTEASKENPPAPPPASQLLIVDEASLHADDVAVRLRDLPHLINILLRFNRTVLELGPAVVSAAPCKAAHPSQREDRFPTH